MSAKKKSTVRLSEHDLMFLVFGTGMCSWTASQRRYFRKLWDVHGERITAERREQGLPPCMVLTEFDPELDKQLLAEWQAEHWPPQGGNTT